MLYPEEERTRKQTGVWSTSKRGWTWFFLTSCIISPPLEAWESYSNSGLQASISCDDCRKVQEALQQNNAVDQMPAGFFTTKLCHHVSSWISVFPTPSWPLPHQWRLHWPCLLNGQGSHSGLNTLVHIIHLYPHYVGILTPISSVITICFAFTSTLALLSMVIHQILYS